MKKKHSKTTKQHSDQDMKRYVGALSEYFDDKFKALAEQYGSIIKTQGSHTQMIGGLMEDVEIVKANVELLKGSVRIKVDYPDFVALEKRVRLVETKLHR